MNNLVTFGLLKICLGISFLVPFFALGQNHNLPLNQTFDFELDRRLLSNDQIRHTSFKPILERETGFSEDDRRLTTPSLFFTRRSDKSFVARKLFHEHFISLDTGLVTLTIDPLFNLELGKELKDDPREINLFKNMRGFNIKLKVGDKVAIESSFRENQTNLPFYLDARTDNNQVAYGQGRIKTFKDDGFDFAMASSYISYSPSDRVNLQAGHGKHFIGEGHRSLLLSDLAFNYPFLKINSNWFDHKIQYQNLYTIFQDLERVAKSDAAEALFARKQSAFHYLEFNPNAKFSIALFEGVVFPSLDTTGNIDVGANFLGSDYFFEHIN